MKPGNLLSVLALALLPVAGSAQQADGNLSELQLQGRQALQQACGVCHLQPVRNSPRFGPPLSKASAGGNDDIMRAFIVNGTDRMPSFKYHLKPTEIDAIIAYMKTIPAEAPKGDAK